MHKCGSGIFSEGEGEKVCLFLLDVDRMVEPSNGGTNGRRRKRWKRWRILKSAEKRKKMDITTVVKGRC